MKTLTIEIPEGKKAEWVNGVLTLVNEDKTKTVFERIKTFNDACKELGEDNSYVKEYRAISKPEMAADFLAYLKLRIIAAALNEGWTPKFANDEWRYYTWYDLYKKEEWDELDEHTKRERGVSFGGRAVHGAAGGFVNAYMISDPLDSIAVFNSCLCFKSSDLAIYAGKQFAALWLDFCYGTASLPAPTMRK